MMSHHQHRARTHLKRGRLDQQGLTLVELLVAVSITAVIVGAGFTILTTTQKATRANDQTVETQQNVRIAMELIARDIKMAGFGMLQPPNVPVPGPSGTWCSSNGTSTGTAVAIAPLDQNPAGNDTGSDRIRLVVPIGSSGSPTWTLAGAVGGIAGFNQITLPGSPVPGAVANMISAGLAAGSSISISGAATTTVTSVNAGSNTIDFTGVSAISGPTAFGAGTPVYLLECVTYSIGTTTGACGGNAPCLLRNNVSIADGIEDIQFAYACDGCVTAINTGIIEGIVDNQGGAAGFDQADFVTNNAWATNPMTPDKIRLVQVTIVSRQTATDQGFGETGNQTAVNSPTPLQVSDHNHANGVFIAGDYASLNPPYAQYRRRALTRTISARNVGL